MRTRICCRIHPRQIFKWLLLFAILWIVWTSVWNHFRRSKHVTSTGPSGHSGHVTGDIQKTLDYISHNLLINYQVIRNEEKSFLSQLTLKNGGNTTIERCCWTIFFYHLNLIYCKNIRDGIVDNKLRFYHDDTLNKPESSSSGLEIRHVNGNTYRLDTTNSFQGLKPGDEVKIVLTGFKWIVSRSQIVPNWYVASDDPYTDARLLWSTAGDDLKFVGRFETEEQTSRSKQDALRPYTPERRYEKNTVQDFGTMPQNIVPTPLVVKQNASPKELHVESLSWSILHAKGLENEVKYLKEHLNIESSKEQPSNIDINSCATGSIVLQIVKDSEIDSTMKSPISTSSYKLVVNADKECVLVSGTSAVGVFYGIVSLVSLADQLSPTEFRLRGIEVIDSPRYEHRGLMVDVARNFHTKEELTRLMDVLAMYKMNKLHLHLSDDEAWRLEIPGLEELTQFGSRRGHDLKALRHLMSMLGSGPTTNSSGSGFYSTFDYRQILQHAVSRHIEIIPEFDMPGHSHAALKSMEFRRQHLTTEGYKEQAQDYLLSDPDDKSSFTSAQYFTDGVINPCLDSSYRFVQHVISEVVKMHKGIMPLRSFHFGGDEVPSEAYGGSPACKEFLQTHKTMSSTKDLKSHFIREVSNIMAHHGLEVMGWEDAFSDSSGHPIPLSQLKAKVVTSQAWYNIWEHNFSRRAYEYANIGYKIILSPATVTYFDNPQEPDPEDWGLHWATRYVDAKRTFYFSPDSLYDNIDFNVMGLPISKQQMCGSKIQCPELKSPENIIGLEAAMWSEVIRTADRMDAMLWPRLLAVAERSWHKADWELMKINCVDATQCQSLKDQRQARKLDWTKFANTVGYKELRRLEAFGIKYYLPRPGARVVNGKLEVNAMFPGLVVQISTNNGSTWKDYDSKTTYKGKILLATRSFDWKRRSTPINMNID